MNESEGQNNAQEYVLFLELGIVKMFLYQNKQCIPEHKSVISCNRKGVEQ